MEIRLPTPDSILQIYEQARVGTLPDLNTEDQGHLHELMGDDTPAKEASAYLPIALAMSRQIIPSLLSLAEKIQQDGWQDGYGSPEDHLEVLQGFASEIRAYHDACYIKDPDSTQRLERFESLLK